MNAQILQEITNLCEGKIIYSGGKLKKSQKLLSLNFVSNFAPTDNFIEKVKEICKKYASFAKEIEINVKKIITQPQFVISACFKWFEQNHLICANAINENDISAEIIENSCIVKLNVEHTVYNYILARKINDELTEFLKTQFVENFEVKLKDTGTAEIDKSKLELKLTEKDMRKNVIRTLTVDDVTRLFDNDKTKTAFYMADVKDHLGEVYLAGKITSIRELTTKTDKTYFIIDFIDRTGSCSGAIFPTKANLPKVQKLSVGSEIIVRGEFEIRNNFHNLRILSINYCAFPKNFVPVQKPKRPVPKEYEIVFPKELEIDVQENFLEDVSIPACFKGRTFVVFDLETTGTDATSDKITEIGAVKIVDGKIESYFETFVNPQKRIPTEVVNLTGITDEMVADAPLFEDVCPDFYKYCHGATLVAHNIEFDSKFIRKNSEPLDYIFDHPQLDTLALGRECITGVSNYKLNTLCAKFDISFNHHRAYSDALACAKLLIEIMRIKKEFPI